MNELQREARPKLFSYAVAALSKSELKCGEFHPRLQAFAFPHRAGGLPRRVAITSLIKGRLPDSVPENCFVNLIGGTPRPMLVLFNTTRTLSGPPSTGVTIAMDGGVADTARANTTM